MAWDIYGNTLQHGYCEVHPSVHEGYPCSYCMEESYAESQRHEDQPGPCEGCYYATGDTQDCDGTCQTLPKDLWECFKTQEIEVPF
jgi:hypothetical protein